MNVLRYLFLALIKIHYYLITLYNLYLYLLGWFSDAAEDPWLPSLSRKQRILGFFICLITATICFSLVIQYSLYYPISYYLHPNTATATTYTITPAISFLLCTYNTHHGIFVLFCLLLCKKYVSYFYVHGNTKAFIIGYVYYQILLSNQRCL